MEHTLETYCYNASTKSFVTKCTTKALGPADVLVKTTHSGVCFTDVHAKEKGCGLGHEGVGIIESVGEAVRNFSVGDRVGWGWLHSSCGHCETCVTGYRQYCAEAVGFAFSDLDQGAFGDYRIIDSQFVYLIPDSISSLHAGPFMCAGASVYEALDAAGTRPSDRVGVVGLGGLGHMAVLFAKAMGCAVTVISSDEEKMADAFQLGADEYRTLAEPDVGTRYSSITADSFVNNNPRPMSINVLLVTSNAVPDLVPIMPLLARRATIVLMTIQQGSLQIPYMDFVLPGHRLIASTEASRNNHIKMLDFAARHRIEPWVVQYPMNSEGIAQAFEKLETGTMRYRGVVLQQA